jgi:hypothetical protein
VVVQVPEKRFWYLKIKALAASGQWEQLRQFANEKKSPVGYKPFAQVGSLCIDMRVFVVVLSVCFVGGRRRRVGGDGGNERGGRGRADGGLDLCAANPKGDGVVN